MPGGLVLAALLAGCAAPGESAGPSATAVPSAAPAATASPIGTASLTGTWTGALRDPNGTYPIRLAIGACDAVGDPCGELEYEDPDAAGTVLCASELTFTGLDGEAFSFGERLVYHPGLCLETSFRIVAEDPDTLRVDQLIDGTACCTGTLKRETTGPVASPGLLTVDGLGRTTTRLSLGGSTTQYGAVAVGSIWLPIDDAGMVARIDAGSGAVVATIETGAPRAFDGPPSDPHAVVAGPAGIWVAQARARAVGRIDPDTNALAESIAVGVAPYALALDGETLWVASFEDDAVVPVDLARGTAGTPVSVLKPTGIAVGFGSVWVVQHRDDAVVRIDLVDGTIEATIPLGERGPSDVCGMCVENIVIADGAVWTANNHGRSIGRIDPRTNAVGTIAVPLRVWSVAIGAGAVWASQFDATAEDRFTRPEAWGVIRVDTATSGLTSFNYPGAFGVHAATDTLWIVVPGRRGDELARVALEP